MAIIILNFHSSFLFRARPFFSYSIYTSFRYVDHCYFQQIYNSSHGRQLIYPPSETITFFKNFLPAGMMKVYGTLLETVVWYKKNIAGIRSRLDFSFPICSPVYFQNEYAAL